MAKPSKNAGHLYRAAFCLLIWIGLLVAPFRAPARFVRNAYSFPTMIGILLLAASFTIFTVVIWLTDRGRAK